MLGNMLCYFVISAVDTMLQVDPAGNLAFTIMGLSRAIQGACNGLLTVTVQVGYFAERSIRLISSYFSQFSFKRVFLRYR
jgi:hypothetical protein